MHWNNISSLGQASSARLKLLEKVSESQDICNGGKEEETTWAEGCRGGAFMEEGGDRMGQALLDSLQHHHRDVLLNLELMQVTDDGWAWFHVSLSLCLSVERLLFRAEIHLPMHVHARILSHVKCTSRTRRGSNVSSRAKLLVILRVGYSIHPLHLTTERSGLVILWNRALVRGEGWSVRAMRTPWRAWLLVLLDKITEWQTGLLLREKTKGK
jgi:hypothetical protein